MEVTKVFRALLFLLIVEFVRRTDEYFNTGIYHYISRFQLQKVETLAAVFCTVVGCRI
jgi:hypothetical protein